MAESPASTPPTSGHAVLRMVAFTAIGTLVAPRFSSDPEALVIGAALGAIAGVVLLGPLRWMLWLANPAVRSTHGYAGIRKAVGAGYLTMVPFALLALVAEVGLGWDALTSFALAGFMAGSVAAGVEVSRVGGRAVLNLIIGALHGFGLTMIWTFLMLMVQVSG